MKSSESPVALVPGGEVAPGERIDFGRPMVVAFGRRIDVRVVVIAGIVTLLALVCGFLGLLLGKFALTPTEVFQGLFGVATSASSTRSSANGGLRGSSPESSSVPGSASRGPCSSR